MELVAQPRALGHGSVPRGGQQVEHRRLVLGAHDGKGGRLPTHEERDGQGVQGVALARLTGTPAGLGRPAGADLVDRLAGRDQVLGQPAAVAPRPLDAPPPGGPQRRGPPQQVAPPRRAVRHPAAAPPPAPRRLRHRLVHPLVGVHPQRQHPSRPPLRCDRARSRGRDNSLGFGGRPRPASLRPAPEELGGGATHQNQGTRRRGQFRSGSARPAALASSYRELHPMGRSRAAGGHGRFPAGAPVASGSASAPPSRMGPRGSPRGAGRAARGAAYGANPSTTPSTKRARYTLWAEWRTTASTCSGSGRRGRRTRGR